MKHLHLKIFLLLIIISPNILLGQISGTKTIWDKYPEQKLSEQPEITQLYSQHSMTLIT